MSVRGFARPSHPWVSPFFLGRKLLTPPHASLCHKLPNASIFDRFLGNRRRRREKGPAKSKQGCGEVGRKNGNAAKKSKNSWSTFPWNSPRTCHQFGFTIISLNFDIFDSVKTPWRQRAAKESGRKTTHFSAFSVSEPVRDGKEF